MHTLYTYAHHTVTENVLINNFIRVVNKQNSLFYKSSFQTLQLLSITSNKDQPCLTGLTAQGFPSFPCFHLKYGERAGL
jgi:hypothetical protein